MQIDVLKCIIQRVSSLVDNFQCIVWCTNETTLTLSSLSHLLIVVVDDKEQSFMLSQRSPGVFTSYFFMQEEFSLMEW